MYVKCFTKKIKVKYIVQEQRQFLKLEISCILNLREYTKKYKTFKKHL